MAGWEEKISPLMKERLVRIGEATPEEKERIKDSGLLDSLLSKFYKGELSPEGLWRALKEYKDKGKSHLLKEAQLRLIDSVSLGSAPMEFQRRRDAILAAESLKEDQNTATIELGLNSIEGLQGRYKDEMQQAYNNLKAQVERNPQLRMQQIKQGQATIVMQLSVDEAVKASSEWKNFISYHEKRYSQEFAKVVEKLKGEVK
jgi:hypothetical protein